ncbi:Rieske (2Fe-2S) protein [Actinomadura graeca]|uniref:Cytochrome bc1 complex Rieske iron-sulfur subunit n=1 Tax=Actinomadura graeca TaxID=2750812 RepID=A0ABX8QMV2_9ACTN|nr:Rieske (2Fe-2S) protein [Actinomadura graeca]QXJ20023.1 Rieske (2Fe-2S) protein [Actinomadura graeca]
MTDEVTPGAGPGIGRRAALCCAGTAGVMLLAGCGGDDGEPKDLSGKEVAKTADIPVGGGKVYPDTKVVVTQPSQGSFKAFTAVCPHQGCTVGTVSGGLIKCPCHGSEFAIADGAVRHGPAESGLKEYPVRTEGGGIVIL